MPTSGWGKYILTNFVEADDPSSSRVSFSVLIALQAFHGTTESKVPYLSEPALLLPLEDCGQFCLDLRTH